MKKLFVVLAVFAALTMAGCAASGVEGGTLPGGNEAVGGTTEGDSGMDSENGTDGLPEPEPDPEPEPEPEPEKDTYKKYVTLTADGVNIRRGAGTSHSVLGVGEADTSYTYLGETGGWYRIRYKNSEVYVSKKYADATRMKASKNDRVEDVIAVGHKLLGTKYVYGAVRYHDGKGNKLKNFTVSAFDCSSLMQYMFYMGADGHLLDVTTRTQVVQGKAVARGDLQRGDLMFFTNAQRYDKTGVERIGHVALYLGDNLILHTASDYAKIEEISATRWKYYVQSRRMI